MTRHSLAALLVFLCLAVPVQAQDTAAAGDRSAPVIARIESEGFTISSVRRTLLGRTLIVSQNGMALREVVLNRFTGEILRDRQFPLDENARTAPATSATGNTNNAGSAGAGAGNGAGAGGTGGVGGSSN